MKRLLLVLGFLTLLAGCSTQGSRPENSWDDTTLRKAKVQAQSIVDAAHAAFFATIPTSYDDAAQKGITDEIPVESWGLKEEIMAYAWESYITGNTTPFWDFLKESLMNRFYNLKPWSILTRPTTSAGIC